MIGFHYAVIPSRRWKDFPTYLAHLENNDPITMRDKVLDFYLNYEPCEKAGKQIEGTRESLLADVEFFSGVFRNQVWRRFS